MKNALMLGLILMFGGVQAWTAETPVVSTSPDNSDSDFDRIRDTRSGSNGQNAAASQIDGIRSKIEKRVSSKCDNTGCLFFQGDQNGNEFKVTLGFGDVGNNRTYVLGGIGYDDRLGDSNDNNYGISVTYTRFNITCKYKVNQGTFEMIETYQALMNGREYVQEVYDAMKSRENLEVPAHIVLVVNTLASVKPNENCGTNRR